jgi:hypothetical protein
MYVTPEATRLDADIQRRDRTFAEIGSRAQKQQAAYRTIDTLFERTLEVRDLSRVLRAYQDHLDGIQPTSPQPPARTIHDQPHVRPPTTHPAPKPPQITMGM